MGEIDNVLFIVYTTIFMRNDEYFRATPHNSMHAVYKTLTLRRRATLYSICVATAFMTFQ